MQIDWIKDIQELASKNQVFTGMVSAGALGAAMYQLKGIGGWVATKVKRSLLASVEFNSEDSTAYDEAAAWIFEQNSFKNITTVVHKGEVKTFMQTDEDIEHTLLTPEDGVYFGRLGWRPMWLRTSKIKKEQYGGFTYSIKISVFSTNRKIIEKIIAEISAKKKKTDRIKVFVGNHDTKFISKREWHSVFLEDTVRFKLEEALERFKKNKDIYKRMGTPYKLNLLLHGPPGTGKSSLALAIASRENMPVVYIKSDASETELINSFSRGTPSVILIEDIDATKINVERKKKEFDDGGITLSTILNCLDGLLYSEGSIVILTTNKREVLDEALTRSKRIDHTFLLNYFTPLNAAQIFSKELGVDLLTATCKIDEKFGGLKEISPAELHTYISDESLQAR